jgi:hypothetical protein
MMIGNKEEKQKNPSFPHPLKKKKNWTLHECMLSLPLGCMKISLPKTVCHQFWPRLMARFRV